MFQFLLLTIWTDCTQSEKLRITLFLIFTLNSMILLFYSSAKRFVNIQLAHKQSLSVPKKSLNVSMQGFDVIKSHIFTRVHGCNC